MKRLHFIMLLLAAMFFVTSCSELFSGSDEVEENYNNGSSDAISFSCETLAFESWSYSGQSISVYANSSWTARVVYSDGSEGVTSYFEEEEEEDDSTDSGYSDVIVDSTTSESYFEEDQEDEELAEDYYNFDPTDSTVTDWLRIGTNEGSKGSTDIYVYVFANSRTDKRTATIVLTDANGDQFTLEVTHAAGLGDILGVLDSYVRISDESEIAASCLSEMEIDVDSESGMLSLLVAYNTPIKIEFSDSWLSANDPEDDAYLVASLSDEAETKGYTSMSVSQSFYGFCYEANDDYGDRTATITISAKNRTDMDPVVVTVTQSYDSIIDLGDEPMYSVVSLDGGVFNVTFDANMTLEISEMPDWITLIDSSESRATTTRVYNFLAESFSTKNGYGRCGSIVFKNSDTGFEFNYGVSQGDAAFYDATSATVGFEEYLTELFGSSTYLNTMEGIVVAGKLDQTSLEVLGTLAKDKLLIDIDLSEVDVVGDIELKYFANESEVVDGDAIPAALLYGASYLTRFEMPKNIKYIGDYAFSGCNKLDMTTDELIADDVEYIGYDAFYTCSSLSGDMKLPETLTYLGESAFANCSSIAGSLTFPSQITKIYDATFRGCSSLTGELVIPSTITSIGASAFIGCSNLSGDLVIPSHITYVDQYTFRNCTGFTSLTLEEGVRSIAISAFYGCSGISNELVLPSTISSIGTYAFYNCGITGALTIPGSFETVNKYAFYGTNITSLTLEEGITEIDVAAFAYCSKLDGTVTFPSTLTSIAGDETNKIGAFSYCSSLDKVEFNALLSEIEHYAFYECEELTGELNFGTRLESIGRYAFAECSSISTINFNSNLTYISNYAFYKCSGVTGTLEIPSSVGYIGSYAFEYCYNIDYINVYWTSADDIATLSTSSFYATTIFPDIFESVDYGLDGYFTDNTIYIPYGTMDLYLDTYWKYYTLEERVYQD
ncbi:MAG: leucine-rich repeat protein [Rikenellaceae bacterium]